jgi:hypothetical protein
MILFDIRDKFDSIETLEMKVEELFFTIPE